MRFMRPLRASGLSLAAMLLLLLGTAAPAMVRMTCVMGGHSELQVGQPADCCPTDHQHASDELKPICCEMLQARPQRADFVPGSHPALSPTVPVALTWPVIVPLPLTHVVADARPSNLPPLPLLRMLACTGAFRL